MKNIRGKRFIIRDLMTDLYYSSDNCGEVKADEKFKFAKLGYYMFSEQCTLNKPKPFNNITEAEEVCYTWLLARDDGGDQNRILKIEEVYIATTPNN